MATITGRRSYTSDDDFWTLVEKSRRCWLWRGGVQCGGRYGTFRNQTAHRVAWTLTHGPIPKGMYVLHKCDNGLCVRPAHLFLGTQADNLRDMSTKGRGSHQGIHGSGTCTHTTCVWRRKHGWRQKP